MYDMYPTRWVKRQAAEAQQHQAPFFGGLGFDTDYGVDAAESASQHHEVTAQRPLSAAVAEMAMRDIPELGQE